MAEFPLLKMINIGGRQTPFAFPQHSTLLRGYVETGEKNPLPTKDELVNKTLTELKETLESQELKVKNVKITNAIEVSNLPETQKVEVTNQKESQDVKVTNNPIDYPDVAVKAELELIKQGIADNKATNDLILARLDNPIDTQVTGSIVEDAIPVKNLKETYSESVTLDITAGVTESIKEYPFPCELTSFSLGTNDRGVSVRIENKVNGSYDSGVRIVHPSGVSTNPVAPSVLNTIGGENDFWSEFVYDTERDLFAFGMKRVAVFSQGMRIRVSGTRDANVAITYMVTRLEG